MQVYGMFFNEILFGILLISVLNFRFKKIMPKTQYYENFNLFAFWFSNMK